MMNLYNSERLFFSLMFFISIRCLVMFTLSVGKAIMEEGTDIVIQGIYGKEVVVAHVTTNRFKNKSIMRVTQSL